MPKEKETVAGRLQNFVEEFTSKCSNSNLRTHIKLIHPNDLDNFNNSAKKRSNNNLNQCSKQYKIDEVGKISVKKLTQAEFDAANLQLIVSTVSPFSFIEHPAFLRYCKITCNKVPVSRRTLMRNVQCIYKQMISQIINDLENIKYVCLTADCWSIFHRSYIGFTVHWIDPLTLHRHSKGQRTCLQKNDW